jgi:hypothetical protein
MVADTLIKQADPEVVEEIARRHRHVPLDLQAVERFEDGVVQLRYRVENHS